MERKDVKFGVLLPVTSRGLEDPSDCIQNVTRFAKSLKETTKGDTCSSQYQLKVYVGVDESDTFLSKSPRIQNVLMKHGIFTIETKILNHPPGSICAIWRDLARRAHEDEWHCTYTVLLGDDIFLKTAGWMSSFNEAFLKLESQRGVPRGFGCVAFSDRYFPGFPTFPVLGRIHLDIFAGEVVPKDFINQDGDPYLFQLYRRWGCSVMLQNVYLENTMGGSQKPRYEKNHCRDWSFAVLDAGVETVRSWLNQNQNLSHAAPKEMLTLDVVVPTFRVPLEGLDAIINLNKSETLSAMTIIIVDNPQSPLIDQLKQKYDHGAFNRIRVNPTNAGASQARNRGLAESAADYVLFLDDDVIPDEDILIECEKVIRRHPKSCGFVGNCRFPDPTSSVISSAIVFSGVTYFWGIAKVMKEDIPWGVTANLLIRRVKDGVWFDLRFPKTGGGEDIDFCLRKRDFHVRSIPGGEGFRAAPEVNVTHPWWNNGAPSFNRFRRWGNGDGALVKMYPQFTYLDRAPNSAETVVLGTILVVMTALATTFTGACCVGHLFYFFLLSLLAVLIANVLHDIYRHVFSNSDNFLPELRGYLRVMAAAESSMVRMASEWGRLEGMIGRREWAWVGWRFDWFVGRLEKGPINTERRHSLGRFALWLILLVLARWVQSAS